jgi:hypothetical protein
MRDFKLKTLHGWRTWQGDSALHACEQHYDAFPKERVTMIKSGTTGKILQIPASCPHPRGRALKRRR